MSFLTPTMIILSLSCGIPVLTTTATPWKLINDYEAGFVFDFSKENLLLYLEKFFSKTKFTSAIVDVDVS